MDVRTKCGIEIIIVNFAYLAENAFLQDRLVGFVLIATKKECGVFMKHKRAWLGCWYWWWVVVIVSLLSAYCIVVYLGNTRCGSVMLV
jgi:hypothetical protein